jgi:hypothetical protein
LDGKALEQDRFCRIRNSKVFGFCNSDDSLSGRGGNDTLVAGHDTAGGGAGSDRWTPRGSGVNEFFDVDWGRGEIRPFRGSAAAHIPC